ncbi:hypothetical protein FE257_011875 [Aspergillus nanangensis]|uniref:Uncharacterized protein n=1 Tax=Aspergillus nanangensis TaxID=2582783 RepID=A0AAD4CIL8_ASPNN|nr:hypothetical protein FE257_011875 [Aspergillus nanangensis]
MAVMSHSGVITIGVTSCPLCDSSGPESDPEFIGHVLQCIHDFSMRSLPWAGHPPAAQTCWHPSEWDNGEVPEEDNQDVHFENNAYFDLESAQDSLEALERSSKSFSLQEVDFDNLEQTNSLSLPFPIPSYIKGSQYAAHLEAAYGGMIHETIAQIEDK